jgi:hypothetical protein
MVSYYSGSKFDSDSNNPGSSPGETYLGITQLVEWRIVVDRLLSKTPHVAGSIPAPEILIL